MAWPRPTPPQVPVSGYGAGSSSGTPQDDMAGRPGAIFVPMTCEWLAFITYADYSAKGPARPSVAITLRGALGGRARRLLLYYGSLNARNAFSDSGTRETREPGATLA